MRLENPVKETLRNGGSAIGVFIPMPSPDIVEIVALAGFDFALLDAEHGRISPDDLQAMHAEYKNLDLASLKGCRVFLDGRGVFNRAQVEAAGLSYIGIG